MVTRGRIPDAVLRGVIDEVHFNDMRLRNLERAKALIVELGSRYCCHPDNSPTRKREQPAAGLCGAAS